MSLKKSIIHAKHEIVEFVVADILLVSGGFLIGTDYVSDNVLFGFILASIGLFLGLRVLLKFSSDLRQLKNHVGTATELLHIVSEDIENNQRDLDNADQKLQVTTNDLVNTKFELQKFKEKLDKSLSKFKEVEEKNIWHSHCFF